MDEGPGATLRILFTKMSPSEELFTLQVYKNGLFMGTEGIFETM